MLHPTTDRAWAEVSLDCIAYNYQAMCEYLQSGKQMGTGMEQFKLDVFWSSWDAGCLQLPPWRKLWSCAVMEFLFRFCC